MFQVDVFDTRYNETIIIVKLKFTIIVVSSDYILILIYMYNLSSFSGKAFSDKIWVTVMFLMVSLMYGFC